MLKFKNTFSINFKDDGVKMYLQMWGCRKFIDRGFCWFCDKRLWVRKKNRDFHFSAIQFSSIKEWQQNLFVVPRRPEFFLMQSVDTLLNDATHQSGEKALFCENMIINVALSKRSIKPFPHSISGKMQLHAKFVEISI